MKKTLLIIPIPLILIAMAWAFRAPMQQLVQISGPIPAGTNTIGSVNQGGAPWSVSQSGAPWSVSLSGSTPDPCSGPKSSVQKHITSATTTALVPVSGSTVVYVCGFVVSMVGTILPDTIQLEQGTGAACASSPVALTPAFNSGVLTAGATVISYGSGEATVTSTAASNGLCAVSTVGTGPSIDILVTFVQQ